VLGLFTVAEDDVQQEDDGVVEQNGSSPQKSNGGASDVTNGVKKMNIKEEVDNGRSCTGGAQAGVMRMQRIRTDGPCLVSAAAGGCCAAKVSHGCCTAECNHSRTRLSITTQLLPWSWEQAVDALYLHEYQLVNHSSTLTGTADAMLVPHPIFIISQNTSMVARVAGTH
jgi:hypothetical protein